MKINRIEYNEHWRDEVLSKNFLAQIGDEYVYHLGAKEDATPLNGGEPMTEQRMVDEVFRILVNLDMNKYYRDKEGKVELTQYVKCFAPGDQIPFIPKIDLVFVAKYEIVD